MEQDYVFSLNHLSKNPEFKQELISIQEKISKELFDEEYTNPTIPEDLDVSKAMEIRDFARETTNKILQDYSQLIKDPNQLQDKISFEVSKLDDVIYLKYGYRNKVIIKAFEKYGILERKGAAQPAAQNVLN